MPAVRIGRLAVDLKFQGRGLGAALLADAVGRTLQAPPAVFTLLVDGLRHGRDGGLLAKERLSPWPA